METANRFETMNVGVASRELGWHDLYRYYMKKGDKWTAWNLQVIAESDRATVVPSLTRSARERLHEPLAVVLYDAESQRLGLYGEKLTSMYISILGQTPQEAGRELSKLICGYIDRVAQHIGMGYAHWKWNGEPPCAPQPED